MTTHDDDRGRSSAPRAEGEQGPLHEDVGRLVQLLVEGAGYRSCWEEEMLLAEEAGVPEEADRYVAVVEQPLERGGNRLSLETAEDVIEELLWAGVVYTPDSLDDELERLNDLAGGALARPGMYDALVGRYCWWHNGELLPIVLLSSGQPVLKMWLACTSCGKADDEEVFLASGLHHGAWCYVVDAGGHYRANLRDQVYVCEACLPTHHKRLSEIAAQAERPRAAFERERRAGTRREETER